MSGDFFSSVPVRPASTDAAPHGDFAHAIHRRFGAADLRTARLLPGDLPQQPHIPPPQPRAPPPPSQHAFASVPPSALPAFLDDPRALVLDIRPHAAHVAARINNAISLSVPTTLLKRPLFSLSKLSLMLPSPSSRARFADWSSASRILVYDTDSVHSPDNSIIAGLLRKFRAEGFAGELAWVSGGFQAVWKEARHLATTDRLLLEEEDDPDAAAAPGTLRASHLPKAAFSLSSTIAAHPRLGRLSPSHPLPNTPAPSASRAANPFFDTIRQNVELSHGVTERIPLRLPRRVRRRIHDLPFPWLRDIAHRSALRHTPSSCHPGLDTFESGSESSDNPTDPDESDPTVEEGAEALAMQFYRIELAEQRRLRSIMEHHTRESELANIVYPARSRRSPGKGPITVGTSPVQGEVGMRTGAKSVPGTPHLHPFPFSITAAVEKGTKNRYTHIWPFEHARVRIHDGRHQGSHPGRRDKGRVLERGRNTRDHLGGGLKEQGLDQSRHRRSRSSPAFSITGEQVGASLKDLHPGQLLSIATSIGRSVNPPLSPGTRVPEVKIEYDVTEQDCRISGPSTPATVLPLLTSPFYTPMETFPASTPTRAWPHYPITLPSSISVSPGTRLGATQLLPSSPSLSLRLPNRPGGLLPSIREQTWPSESLPSFTAPFGGLSPGSVGEVEIDVGLRRGEPSPADDYVNASYVQPLGTRKRYIATQGPLPSTYIDFWTLVWEQNVHVIVMLTREIENAMVKCGSYWTETEYGPLRLELLSISPPLSPGVDTDISKQGFFAIRDQNHSTSRDQPALITRVFALSHTSYPGVPPRRITHLQYLEWSDMNVPEDPRGVLDLVQKLERVVAGSTPGPSPSGSMSPGSASGSVSDSQSPDTVPDQNGYGTSLLSPTSAGFGRRRRGCEWRHPELDPKTGIAAFALGRTAPVLLHCSAGVGRTGGFIAVDAVLDGIRRELRKKREEQILSKASGARPVIHATDSADMDGVEASGELSFRSMEGGTRSMGSSGKESASDPSERMDVDEATAEPLTKDSVHMINTVPIHVSAGDITKGRRRHRHSKGPSGDKIRSSPGPLVVHVPCMGADDVPEETNITGIDLGDPNEAGWQSSSTREWAEQVSDQAHVETEDLAPLPSLPLSTRESSPGSASVSSGPSTLNSAGDSMNGSGSASGSGNDVQRKSGTASLLVSKPGSGSISLSTSGSGSGTGSRLGSSLLHVRLRDSSVTSISAVSTDSPPPRHGPKLNSPSHRPMGIHAGSDSDMEIDCPLRPVSAPLQPIHSNAADPQRAAHTIIGSSPVASRSSHFLPPRPAGDSTSFFGNDAAERLALRASSGTESDKSHPQEFARGECANAERSRKILLDESETPVPHSKRRSNLQLNTEFGSLKVPGTCYSAESPTIPSGGSQGRKRVAISPISRIQGDLTSQQFTPALEASGAPEYDQCNGDQQVIDYKLPRQLHSDLSPPLISSFAEPICMVIQDMREQRMSLCQSLRQYVFVHAAIIEGALRIVDEERELWGWAYTSDDASSGEGEPGTSFGESGHWCGHNEGPKTWLGRTDKAVMTMEPEHPYRTLALHIAPHTWNHGTEVEIGSGRPPAPASSSSSVSSPSKGKRGPSPTELPREDRAGALSLNKRPNIHRQTSYDQGSFSVESSRTLSADGGGSDLAVGTAMRSAPGRPGTPEKVKSDSAIYE